MPVTAARARNVKRSMGPPTEAIGQRAPERPLLRLTRPGEGQFMWLHHGKQGSLQTAFQMARLVREDTVKDEGLQRHAAQLLISSGLDSHSEKSQIASLLCNYVQGVPYIFDPSGAFDSISSARQTLEKGFGDCDDLAVLLATLLALVGFQPRFVLARYKKNSNGYDHVYVDIVLPDKTRMALDPCSRKNGPGWEASNAIERLTFPIFAFPTTSLGDAMQLAATGASIGLSFIPVVGPIAAALVGPIIGMFSRQQQRGEEAARDEYKDEIFRGMDEIKRRVEGCEISPQQGVAAAKLLVTEFYKVCDKFTKKSVAKSCRNFETEDVPGGPQEGAFTTRTARIAAAGGTCKTGSASSGMSAASGSGPISLDSSVSIGGSNFPILLLLAGGAALFFMLKK